VIEEAKRLIDLGLPIIPVCPPDHQHMTSTHIDRCKCAGKTPLIKEWQSHDNTTQKDLQSWISSFKKFNIGLPLGDASGYCGIDVDGDEGVKLLMEMSKGDIPGTWEFSTGAGSRLLYLIPEGIKTKKFKQTGDGAHQECALLCTGQQTVLPPSVHVTGRVYEWTEERSPWDIDCAMAPQWLIDLIRLEDYSKTTNITKGSSTFTINFDTPSNVSDFSLEEEFETEDISFDIPPEVVISKPKEIKEQRGKTGHKIVVTDELLTQQIPEGSRDNTMTAIVGHYCANRDLRRFGKDFILDICLKHNMQYCDPPLEDQAIIDKVTYFYEAETMKDAEYKEQKGNKTTFEASKMAKCVLQYLNNGGIHLHFDQYSKIYYYTSADKGPWTATRNYALINRWIRDVLTSTHYGDTAWDKRSYIDETRTALEESFTMAYKTVDDFDLGAHSEDLREYIVVNNGMVNWDSKTLVPWDPKYKTTVSFDIDYDPHATCPRFERYLEEWLPSESVRQVVQEYLGYCLIPNTNYRKALFLYGKGKNGKSMLVEFLQSFFGTHAAALSYDGLFARFGPSSLKDKLVNIFDDTTVSFTKETSTAKNLIAGGTISAEYKGKDSFQFANVARFIYSSQETPRTGDNTIAWYDRWFFVKFPNQFRASNKVKIEIQTALKEERAGIFNWMMEGLKRLITNDEFSVSPELDLYNIEYRAQNDSVTQFVHNMCTSEGDGASAINDIYQVYAVWCETEALRAVSKKVFVQRVSDMGFERKKGYFNGSSGQSYFDSLRLNKDSEDYKENQLQIAIILSSSR
jgi:putative DNA primase/helicase